MTLRNLDSYQVDALYARPNASVACEDCGWTGRVCQVRPIGTCSLHAGHPSPVGRCPACETLVYLSVPS